MICLTGDLHHASLRTGNQRHCDISEIQTAQRYLKLLEGAGVKATFFVSGKAFAEEWSDLRPIAEHPLIELGGHNWSCLTPELPHRVWKKVLGSYNGPEIVQLRDAERTIAIIEEKTGKRIRAWRNHMYMHGPFTERVLARAGIEVCSDGVKKESKGPEWHPAGIWNFPINVIPDHEHLYHAERTREWVASWQKRYRWSDDFGPESYTIDEWVEIVLDNIEHNEQRGATSNVIIHPITMYLCDRFAAFERILERIAKLECVHVSEAVAMAKEQRRGRSASDVRMREGDGARNFTDAQTPGAQDVREDANSVPNRPRVSIVMRSKNSDWVIGQALAGLYSQDYDDFELIVIDSGSTDRTLELVRAYPHRLLTIEPSEYFPGKVLNYASEHARGEILVFQNSDAVPLTPTTLRRLVEAFDDPNVDAALTRQLPRPDADTWVRRDYASSFPDATTTPDWITISLPMAAVRASAWREHPFYTDAWGSEDTEWGQWARDHGRTIKYVPDALIMHSHNYTLEQLYGRRFIEGEADAFIYGRDEGLAKLVYRTIGSTLRDVAECIRDGDFRDIVRLPARRAVYHWGYLKGHRHGARRKATGDPDWRLGQETVLSRHESNRDPK